MQNSGKFFTFLFSHSSKSKIYFRRVEVSKKLLQNSVLGLASIIVITTFSAGIVGVFNFDLSQFSAFASSIENPTVNKLSLNPIKKQFTTNSKP